MPSHQWAAPAPLNRPPRVVATVGSNMLANMTRYGQQPQVDEIAPIIEWEDFLTRFASGDIAWLQGEHVTLIAPTGWGKTTLAYAILPIRNFVTVVATKPKDSTLEQFGKDSGYTIMKEWKPDLSASKAPKRIIWPKDTARLRQVAAMREKIFTVLEDIFAQGSWCVYLDELRYVCENLNLDKVVKIYLLQARALNISLLGGTQRPAWIPLEFYDQSTHLFFGQEKDEVNLKRISGISSQSSKLIQSIITGLDNHQFLYINQRTGTMYRTTVKE